jgi:hypothetical protein
MYIYINKKIKIMKKEIKIILSKIGDVEEKIYNEFGDDEIENMFDYSKELDDIKVKYKDDKSKLYEALKIHLSKISNL